MSRTVKLPLPGKIKLYQDAAWFQKYSSFGLCPSSNVQLNHSLLEFRSASVLTQ